MLKIDIHTHILPPEIPKFKDLFGYGGFIHLQDCPGCASKDMVDDSGRHFRRVEPNAFDPKIRLKEYDKFDVRVQVLSTVPVMFSYWTKPQDGLVVSKYLNDHIAEVVRNYPKRFVGLGTVPLQSPDLACKEAERCVRDLGLKGIQIGSHVNGTNLSDTGFYPFYSTLEKLGAALFVHPWDMMGQDKMEKYWLPWLVGMPAETSRAISSMIFGGIFEKFPKLRVAFAHGGGSFPFTFDRKQHGFKVRPDLVAVDNGHPPKKYLGRFWVDSLVHGTKPLKYLHDLLGPEKICLGTDYPFPLGELKPGETIKKAKFSKKDQEWMYHKAALKWLDLDKKYFVL